MMKSKRIFLSVLYLLLYSSFSTANLNPVVVTQVEKGINTNVKLLEGLGALGKLTVEEDAKTIQKVLEVFKKLGKIAYALGFVGALVGFILAFIPQENPILKFMKVQFSEVNRKLDSISLQINSLAEEMEWTVYASVYSNDENNIKNSWTKLREFIDSASAAQTEKEKTRLAERFTTFYENTGTESSVHNFHGYLTESNPASLNKNLLILVTEKSKGDFKTLVQFTAYFTSLMVTGLQLNLYYYALKGYDGKNKVREAVTQLNNVHTKIQDVLIDCADSFEIWAEKDVQQIGTKPLPDNKHLAYTIKEHLDKKFNWYNWTVIVHDKKDEEERTYGNSIKVIAQDKVVIHLLHREKGFTVHQGMKAQMEREWNSKGRLCQDKISQWPIIFQRRTMKYLEYIHERPDYAQTIDNELVKLKCLDLLEPILVYETYTVYLKSQKLVENHPCSDVNCNKGECRQIKDTSSGICKCEKMFYGPTCQGSIQDDIDYAAMESEVIGISYQPVPDLTAIYIGLQEMKEYVGALFNTLWQDIQWAQIFIKYNDVIDKFRYLAKVHNFLKNETMSQDQFVSEVESLFTKGNTFLYMMHKFDLMMQGTGFGDKSNILDLFRQSLLTEPLNQDDKSQSNPRTVCSKSYSERIDYFVRIMFAMEQEAVLGWQRYLLIKHESQKGVTPEALQYGPTAVKKMIRARALMRSDEYLKSVFKHYVSEQWSLFNRNGCGLLKAELLSNTYCEKPHHSTDQQEVPLTCQEDYQPFPKTVQCSKKQWSALPVCYTHPRRGSTTCKSENGTTVCTASCSSGWTIDDRQTSDTYRCTKQPCPSFAPRACNRCTKDSVCGDSEVCRNAKCVDGCSVFPCGLNARCSTTNHVQHCTCVSPWILWNGHDAHSYGCRYQNLRWEPCTSLDRIPQNTVTSKTGRHVCRAKGPDGGWHGGWIWIHNVNTCNYEYGWSEKRATSFEVLVDPCGGSGVQWLSGGMNSNSVEIGQAVPWPWITYLVCSRKSNGIPGKLFNTRSGLLCHYGFENRGNRDGNFYTLVKKRCI
ncbi:SE-cephalotoxin-like isoform X1 [Anguilla rostrata]|uniref:SE-cephalotoxin-like isoform X1 n=1 Tax=Anguilla rostrata TaxID=7938 RepID=UPI0030CEA263